VEWVRQLQIKFTPSPSRRGTALQDFNCALDSAAILFADLDQFSAGDGKQLFDNWKRAFDNALKSGVNIDDNALVPPAKDDLEKKK